MILSSLDYASSASKLGQNVVLFPILLIEEPEAHLHPALQYRLLKYIKKRLETERTSRQIFVTTHSTQVTAASGLDPIICMSASEDAQGVRIAYPARAFADDEAGKKSRNYVERYLDATKSNMLFSKGVIFVEGLAEQLLFSCFADGVDSPLEEHHVAVIAVGGSTFRHFLPLFGAGTPGDRQPYGLVRKVALVVDADPTRMSKTTPKAKWKKCWPYQLDHDAAAYEYKAESSVVRNLRELIDGHPRVSLFVGKKTLEYDIALANHSQPLLVTDACVYCDEMRTLATDSDAIGQSLADWLTGGDDDLEALIASLPADDEKRAHRFATCYLTSSEGGKGAHAFELEKNLRDNYSLPPEARGPVPRAGPSPQGDPVGVPQTARWSSGMSEAQEITSDSVLINIEQPFRVLAGPGAGKTHWLIQHIQYVVRRSARLSAVSRVACISYTNTAVNELIKRLGEAADHADISTIHSFLYRNVVKPYLFLLKKTDGNPLVNYAEVSGHDEHHPSIAKVHSWLRANGDGRTIGIKPQFSTLLDLLKGLTWSRSDDGSWSLAPLSSIGMGPHLRGICTSSKLELYKQLYWSEGTIDHDDVLYFAYRILEENPKLRSFLAARFRYLFIDEFQDTLPVQAKIVEWLAQQGTIVGVIGDPEQAIYGFLNSTPEHFLKFSLDGFADYHIADNRRSTGQIVNLLNRVPHGRPHSEGSSEHRRRARNGLRGRIREGHPRDTKLLARRGHSMDSRPSEQ